MAGDKGREKSYGAVRMQITPLASLDLKPVTASTARWTSKLSSYKQHISVKTQIFSSDFKSCSHLQAFKNKRKNRTTNGFLHQFFVLFAIGNKFLLSTWHSASLQENK